VSLEEENIKLRSLLHDVVLYGKGYFEWMQQYGHHEMTSQKQASKQLKEKLKNAENHLNKE